MGDRGTYNRRDERGSVVTKAQQTPDNIGRDR